MKIAHTRLPAALIAAGLFLTAGPLCAAPGDQPVAPLPAAAKPDSKINTRTASLPARGLFVGDKLSDSAKSRLVDLIINAIGLDVEVALLVPVGPWEIDGGGHTDHDLTAARLQSLRKFLTERGIEPRKIFVESRVDPKVTEPRLDVQLVGTPAND